MCIGDAGGHSCVAVLSAGAMDVLWHRRWEQDVGPTIPAGRLHKGLATLLVDVTQCSLSDTMATGARM